jgi:hypothetical protein
MPAQHLDLDVERDLGLKRQRPCGQQADQRPHDVEQHRMMDARHEVVEPQRLRQLELERGGQGVERGGSAAPG